MKERAGLESLAENNSRKLSKRASVGGQVPHIFEQKFPREGVKTQTPANEELTPKIRKNKVGEKEPIKNKHNRPD